MFHLRPSEPDPRDYRLTYMATAVTAASVPTTINLEPICPPVYDQGDIGSCTANSSCCMYSSVYKKTVKTLFLPSRLFLYYNTRVLENTVGFDSGATLRNTLKSLSKTGVCPETLWPYSIQNLFRKPGTAAYSSATTNRAVAYASLDTTNLGTMKKVLVSGSVFVLGMLVYQSFMTMNGTWTVPIPNTNKEKLLGGHAVCVVGYDDSKKCFLVRNSWGTRWGLKGNFWLPYSFVMNPRLAFDAWVLYSVQSPPPGSNIQKN